MRLRDLTFYLLLAYLALMTLPLAFNATSTGLDPSWSYATNYFPGSVYKYGPDVIFTYGPLGFICWPENVDWKLSIAIALRLLVWAVLIAQLSIAYRRRRLAPFLCFLAILSLILAQLVLNYLFDYMLVTAALLLIVRAPPEGQRFWSGTLPLSLLVSLLFLAKASGYMTLMPAFFLYFAVAHWRQRVRPTRASLLRFGCVAIAPFPAYLFYNASLRGLWVYITATASIVSGYNDAMSTYGLPSDYLSLGCFVILLLGFGIYAVWRKWLKPEVLACVAISFFVAMKQGIVRTDHEGFFYGFSFVLFAILVLKCNTGNAACTTGAATFAVLGVLGLIGMDPVLKALSVQQWSPSPHFERVGKLFHWRETLASVAEQTKANLRADALPDSLLTQIHGAPVAVFPWELAFGPANHLNLAPLYTLQSYAAYTNRLDRATADHLRKAPGDMRLLVEWKSIDERHPLLDVPATWEAIYTGFKPDMAASGLLLLQKRDRPTAFAFNSLKQTLSDVRQWQDVPDRDHAVDVSIAFSPTLVGIGQHLVYKINPVYIEFEVDRGMPRRFRVIPDVLRYPFVVNCLPLSGADLESLLFGNVCEEKIKRFRFSGEGLSSFSPSAQITFAEDPAARLQFAVENSAESKGAVTENVGRPDVSATFGHEIALSRYSILNKNGHTQVELYWTALRKPSADYAVFIHALDSKGAIGFQFDHQLKNMLGLSTTSWVEGETVRDSFTVDPPLTCVPGAYTLRLGLYVVKPLSILPLTQATLPRPTDDWRNRAVLIPGVECRPR
jgi:hypothetical protein